METIFSSRILRALHQYFYVLFFLLRENIILNSALFLTRFPYLTRVYPISLMEYPVRNTLTPLADILPRSSR